jgi:hypothetical protein
VNWKQHYESKLKDGSLARELAARSAGLSLTNDGRVSRLPIAFTSPSDGGLTAEEAEQVRAAGKDVRLFAATRSAKNFSEYRALKAAHKQGVALAEPGAGLERKIAPTPAGRFGADLSAWVATLKRFAQRKVRGLVPAAEIDAAQAAGIESWRRLVAKYGAADLVLPDPRMGGGLPGGAA